MRGRIVTLFLCPRRWWIRDVVHLLVMGVLLDVEVVVVINLIIRVIDEAIWVVIVVVALIV